MHDLVAELDCAVTYWTQISILPNTIVILTLIKLIDVEIYLEGVFLEQEHVKVGQGEVVQEFLPVAEGS